MIENTNKYAEPIGWVNGDVCSQQIYFIVTF